MEHEDIEKIRRFSADIRIETVKAIGEAGFGHISGSASVADVLAVLYGGIMKIDPKNIKWDERDWLVLSKGHSAPALYAALALKGFFPMDWLKTVNKPGTNLPSHADGIRVPGIEISTGSLGQGMSMAVGIALANKYLGRESYTYCIVGDGETNEGQVWEGAQASRHFMLDHFILFVDWNKKQLDGTLEQILEPLDLAEKFRAFGFDTQVIKGYDHEAIINAIAIAKSTPGVPHVIVLDTIKGLGISFAEKVELNHYMVFSQENVKEAIEEIEKRYANGTYPGGDSK